MIEVVGRARTLELTKRAARLTGLQNYPMLAEAVGVRDGGAAESAKFLNAIVSGMGDVCTVTRLHDEEAELTQSGLRIVRGLEGDAREDLLACWVELWRGAIQSQRRFMSVDVREQTDALVWTIREVGS